MSHDDYKEALALDALGALDEAERRALGAHLEECEECRAERREMLDVAAALAHAAPPVAPPAELRARILASVAASPRPASLQGERRATDPDGVAARVEASADSARDAAKVLPFEPGRAARSSVIVSKPAFWFGAIAASLLVAALAGALAVLWNRNNEMRAELARVSEQMNQSRGEAERSRSELASEREMREVFAAPDAHIMTLAGMPAAPRARARFAFDPRTGRAILVADGLPAAPAGKAYQLWFIAAGRPPMPGGVFRTDAAGRAQMRDHMPPEAHDATTFAVTLEPERGVSAPTGDKYLVGSES